MRGSSSVTWATIFSGASALPAHEGVGLLQPRSSTVPTRSPVSNVALVKTGHPPPTITEH